MGLGFALYGQRNYLAAGRAFLQALVINPQSGAALKAYDELPGFTVGGEWQAIRPSLDHLLEDHPQSAAANYCYGVSLFRHELSRGNRADFRPAQALLEKAVRLRPKFSEAHLELGNLYAAEKQDRKALAQFLAAAREDPELAAAHYHLGLTYRNLGEMALAEKELALYTRLAGTRDAQMARSRTAMKQFIFAQKPAQATIRTGQNPAAADLRR